MYENPLPTTSTSPPEPPTSSMPQPTTPFLAQQNGITNGTKVILMDPGESQAVEINGQNGVKQYQEHLVAATTHYKTQPEGVTDENSTVAVMSPPQHLPTAPIVAASACAVNCEPSTSNHEPMEVDEVPINGNDQTARMDESSVEHVEEQVRREATPVQNGRAYAEESQPSTSYGTAKEVEKTHHSTSRHHHHHHHRREEDVNQVPDDDDVPLDKWRRKSVKEAILESSENDIWDFQSSMATKSGTSIVLRRMRPREKSTPQVEEEKSQYQLMDEAWRKRMDEWENRPNRLRRYKFVQDQMEKYVPEVKKEREEKEREGRGRLRGDALGAVNYWKEHEIKLRNSVATVPPLLTEEEKKLDVFVERPEAIVTDFNAEHKKMLADKMAMWKEEEKSSFFKLFQDYHKNFVAIASMFEDKETADCILYYYLNKAKYNFKALLPKKPTRVTRYKPPQMPTDAEIALIKQFRVIAIERNAKGEQMCFVCLQHLGPTRPGIKMNQKIYETFVVSPHSADVICLSCREESRKLNNSTKCPVTTCGTTRKGKPNKVLPPRIKELQAKERAFIFDYIGAPRHAIKFCLACSKRFIKNVDMMANGELKEDYDRYLLDVPWSTDENNSLRELAEELGPEAWEAIAERIGQERTPMECQMQYHRLMKQVAEGQANNGDDDPEAAENEKKEEEEDDDADNESIMRQPSSSRLIQPDPIPTTRRRAAKKPRRTPHDDDDDDEEAEPRPKRRARDDGDDEEREPRKSRRRKAKEKVVEEQPMIEEEPLIQQYQVPAPVEEEEGPTSEELSHQPPEPAPDAAPSTPQSPEQQPTSSNANSNAVATSVIGIAAPNPLYRAGSITSGTPRTRVVPNEPSTSTEASSLLPAGSSTSTTQMIIPQVIDDIPATEYEKLIKMIMMEPTERMLNAISVKQRAPDDFLTLLNESYRNSCHRQEGEIQRRLLAVLQKLDPTVKPMQLTLVEELRWMQDDLSAKKSELVKVEQKQNITTMQLERLKKVLLDQESQFTSMFRQNTQETNLPVRREYKMNKAEAERLEIDATHYHVQKEGLKRAIEQLENELCNKEKIFCESQGIAAVPRPHNDHQAEQQQQPQVAQQQQQQQQQQHQQHPNVATSSAPVASNGPVYQMPLKPTPQKPTMLQQTNSLLKNPLPMQQIVQQQNNIHKSTIAIQQHDKTTTYLPESSQAALAANHIKRMVDDQENKTKRKSGIENISGLQMPPSHRHQMNAQPRRAGHESPSLLQSAAAAAAAAQSNMMHSVNSLLQQKPNQPRSIISGTGIPPTSGTGPPQQQPTQQIIHPVLGMLSRSGTPYSTQSAASPVGSQHQHQQQQQQHHLAKQSAASSPAASRSSDDIVILSHTKGPKRPQPQTMGRSQIQKMQSNLPFALQQQHPQPQQQVFKPPVQQTAASMLQQAFQQSQSFGMMPLHQQQFMMKLTPEKFQEIFQQQNLIQAAQQQQQQQQQQPPPPTAPVQPARPIPRPPMSAAQTTQHQQHVLQQVLHQPPMQPTAQQQVPIISGTIGSLNLDKIQLKNHDQNKPVPSAPPTMTKNGKQIVPRCIEDLWEDMSDDEQDSGPVKQPHPYYKSAPPRYSTFDYPEITKTLPEAEHRPAGGPPVVIAPTPIAPSPVITTASSAPAAPPSTSVPLMTPTPLMPTREQMQYMQQHFNNIPAYAQQLGIFGPQFTMPTAARQNGMVQGPQHPARPTPTRHAPLMEDISDDSNM